MAMLLRITQFGLKFGHKHWTKMAEVSNYTLIQPV